MGQVRHGSATTTEAVRRAIQDSQESLRALARRYGINPKTVAKWKKRKSVQDRPTGPKAPHSTVLSREEEAVIVAFRRHTLLALDDCLYALQPTIPNLTRSSLHRCLQRHGISRLPEVTGDKPAKKKFKRNDMMAYLKKRNVELLSAGLDECPMAYKNIDEVMAAQSDLVEPLAKFSPRIVKMDRG